jgi:hypothetical protein
MWVIIYFSAYNKCTCNFYEGDDLHTIELTLAAVEWEPSDSYMII